MPHFYIQSVSFLRTWLDGKSLHFRNSIHVIFNLIHPFILNLGCSTSFYLTFFSYLLPFSILCPFNSKSTYEYFHINVILPMKQFMTVQFFILINWIQDVHLYFNALSKFIKYCMGEKMKCIYFYDNPLVCLLKAVYSKHYYVEFVK